jgi:hypothetical protein
MRRQDVGVAHGRGIERLRVGRPSTHSTFLFIQIFVNGFEFETVKRWPFGARKNSNKICNCRKLNKEKLSY